MEPVGARLSRLRDILRAAQIAKRTNVALVRPLHGLDTKVLVRVF